MGLPQYWVSTSWEWNRDLMPRGYESIESVRIDAVHGRGGITRYAVRQSGACMDANGEWEFEPMPSSRDDEWLNRFRFDTWEAAARAVEKYVKSPLGRFHRMAERD